jgi:SAM-dependent MidA family methyltransferase
MSADAAKDFGKTRILTFERFMEQALYEPGTGYYTNGRDPFGAGGDYYTAEQVQPVFGMLAARMIEPMFGSAGASAVLELGPGRREMKDAFAASSYVPVDVGASLPEHFRGVVFANEFFDALPVQLVERKRNAWREVCVRVEEERCTFAQRTRPVTPEAAQYLDRYHPTAGAGSRVEVNLRAREWVERVSRIVERGWWVIIDYGYTAAEWPRHAHGTLMSYHRHTADEAVLESPGQRDITAHVAWTPLREWLEECGWRVESFRTMARALLDAGERDHFAWLFAGCDAKEELRRRLQLKTLLFGMGETFRVLVASRAVHK